MCRKRSAERSKDVQLDAEILFGILPDRFHQVLSLGQHLVGVVIELVVLEQLSRRSPPASRALVREASLLMVVFSLLASSSSLVSLPRVPLPALMSSLTFFRFAIVS